MSIVKGTAKWAHIQKPNTRFDPRWSINLYVDQDASEILEGEGLVIKEDDQGLFCVFKRNCKTRKGKDQQKPAVVDSSNKPFDGEVGNGSVVNVQYRSFTYGQNNEKVSSDLIAVQVLELNEYAQEDTLDFSEGEGTFDASSIIDDAFDNEDFG